MARHQWWRNGHSHIDEAEIWLVRMGELPEYSPLTSEGKNVWPMWGPGDEQIFFVSDRSGSENLWSVPVDGRDASRLTSFSGGRVLWPTIAVERPVIAFERGFGIWTYDVESETLRELDIRLMGSVEAPRPELRQATDGFDELALSPDGEKLALTVRGEVLAAPAEDDVPAVRVSDTPAAERGVTWSPDSRRVAYVSWRNGTPQVFEYDFTTGTERQLTDSDRRDVRPIYSPDGRYLAYNRGGQELRVRRTASGSSSTSSRRRIASGRTQRTKMSRPRPGPGRRMHPQRWRSTSGTSAGGSTSWTWTSAWDRSC